MKGFILAAGLGTRLKPWTDNHPKALVPVNGIPMLDRVIEKMNGALISDITVNVFHFADQIIDHIGITDRKCNISDERPELLETGGAILKASEFLTGGDEPVLVHNADILSNADFLQLEREFDNSMDAMLLVSQRESSRMLIFDRDMRLKGWHSLATGEYRPSSFKADDTDLELAFSGIYCINPRIISKMKSWGWEGKFSIMDFFLANLDKLNIRGHVQPNLKLLDIGKPDALLKAADFIS